VEVSQLVGRLDGVDDKTVETLADLFVIVDLIDALHSLGEQTTAHAVLLIQ
jgi:hypothetical protein